MEKEKWKRENGESKIENSRMPVKDTERFVRVAANSHALLQKELFSGFRFPFSRFHFPVSFFLMSMRGP